MPSATKVDVRQVGEEIRELIAEIIEVPVEEVGDEVPFSDLGADSLMGMEIIANIEKKYRIEIPEEKYQGMSNLKEVLALVNQYVAS